MIGSSPRPIAAGSTRWSAASIRAAASARPRRWRRELLALLPRASLARLQVPPRSIDFDADLPRQDTGKLYKRLLKDRYWGDRTSRIV